MAAETGVLPCMCCYPQRVGTTSPGKLQHAPRVPQLVLAAEQGPRSSCSGGLAGTGSDPQLLHRVLNGLADGFLVCSRLLLLLPWQIIVATYIFRSL